MSAIAIHSLQILAVLFCVALTGVAVGIRLAEVPEASRRIVPFSGGLLLGIAFFWVMPEVAEQYGWTACLLGSVGGFGLLWAISRFLYPVCPSCSDTHNHEVCAKTLHGFAAPLMAASAIHSFFDGWSVAVSQDHSSSELKMAFLVGIGLHKLPEGLALGVLLLAATGSVWKAGLGAAAVQSCMFVGAFTAFFLASHLAVHWTNLFLAGAAGVFVYLGYHAIEGQLRSRGLSRIIFPALTGAAGAAVLRLVPGL